MNAKIALPVLAGILVAGFAIAQTQTSSSSTSSSQTSKTSQGSGSVWGSASGSAQGSGSASAGGRAGGSASGFQAGSGSGGGAASGGKFKITRPTHAVFYTPNPIGGQRTAGTANSSLWADQKKYYEQLGREGSLLYAGPWVDGEGAMLILNCASDQEAQNIADEDPVVKTLIYVANVRAWNVTYIGPGVVQPDRGQGQSGGR